MPVPSDARCFWMSTHASIPASWSKDTAFSDRYLQGEGDSYTGPVNGGSTTHGHNESSHFHELLGHTHSVSGASLTAPGAAVTSGDPAGAVSRRNHSHVSSTSLASAAPFPETNVSTATVDAVQAKPLSISAIVIQPADGLQDVPDDAVCLTDETTLPTGFVKFADANGRFVLCTVGTGQGGIQLASFSNHKHTRPAHTHTWKAGQESHDHDWKLAGDATPSEFTGGGFGTTTSVRGLAHHDVALGDANHGAVNNNSDDTGSRDAEPLSRKMLSIQNTSGAAATPDGVILPYVNSPASVPDGWLYCDGQAGTPNLRDRQIKCTTVNGEIGDLGGILTHSHTTAHSHTTVAHNHPAGDRDISSVNAKEFPINTKGVAKIPGHDHTWTVGNASPNTSTDGVSTSADDVRYTYRTVIFIKRAAVGNALPEASSLYRRRRAG